MVTNVLGVPATFFISRLSSAGEHVIHCQPNNRSHHTHQQGWDRGVVCLLSQRGWFLLQEREKGWSLLALRVGGGFSSNKRLVYYSTN